MPSGLKLLSVAGLVLSCSCGGSTDDDNGSSSNGGTSGAGGASVGGAGGSAQAPSCGIPVPETCDPGALEAAMNITKASVFSDVLSVSASFDCCSLAESKMWACWEGEFEPGPPVTTRFRVWHAAPAGCDENICVGALSIDLLEIRNAFEAEFGVDAGPLQISLDTDTPATEVVEYTPNPPTGGGGACAVCENPHYLCSGSGMIVSLDTALDDGCRGSAFVDGGRVSFRINCESSQICAGTCGAAQLGEDTLSFDGLAGLEPSDCDVCRRE